MPKNIAVSFFENDEFTTTLAMSRDTSFEALRQRWREASQDSGPACFRLRNLNGAALPEEGCLEQIVPPEENVFAIHVLRAEEKNVRIFGTSLDPVAVRLLPQETTEALTERVKDIVGLTGRVARLLCGGRVLDAGILPSVQLAGCPFIDVDLQVPILACYVESGSFHPVLYDKCDRSVLNKDLPSDARRDANAPIDPLALPAFAKDGEVRALRLFASEPALALTGPGERRAIAWGSGLTVAGDEALCGLATEAALLSEAALGVVVERRMKVQVVEMLHHRSETVLVWPSDKLGHVLTNMHDSLLIEGEPADAHLSFWEAGLQAGSCISVTRRIALSVFDERGAVKKVTADLGECLIDLRGRLGLPEDAFELWCDGVLLRDDERSLMELKLDATSVLMSQPKTRVVHLKSGRAEPLSVGAVRKTTSFCAFLQTASEALKTTLPLETRFVCSCGRIFSNESAERREFPLRCCRATELLFHVEEPPRSEENQTAFRRKETSCETRIEVQEAETQTNESQQQARPQAVDSVRQISVQTDHTVDRTTVQADHTVDRTTVQADHAADRTTVQADHAADRSTSQVPVKEKTTSSSVANVRIVWYFDNRGNFDLNVPFRGALRGRELRAAIAEARGVAAAERLKLLQLRARRKQDGAAVFRISAGLDYADERGERVTFGEWAAAKFHSIRDDEAVLFAKSLQFVIRVERE